MKKMMILSLLISATSLFFVSCGNSNSKSPENNATQSETVENKTKETAKEESKVEDKSPKGIATELCNYLKKGDYQTHFEKYYYEYMYNTKITDAQKPKMVEALVKTMSGYTTKQGGFKDIEISDAKTNAKSGKEYVDIIYTYNSGQITKGAYEFTKKDGVWKITSRQNI